MQKSLLKFLLVVILTTGVTTIFLGQSKIKTRLLHADTSSYDFTGEWQYLSTDVYLFNGSQFTRLINELNFNKEQKGGLFFFKKETNEFLEYLYITASLKNVRFFDQREITYPLYNFRIDREKDNRYRTYISDDIDHIRIIDNFPLYSAKDYIDAEINVHAITNNSGDQVLRLVASQLKNISKITNPSTAVLSLVGELGNFMESSSRRKEYHFRSTIRLYEKKDFDSRIHSVKVFALVTENSEGYDLQNNRLRAYLMNPSHRSVDRKKLKELLDMKDYPYLVVVNYKSLYRMEEVSGDEINFATIEKRKIKIENDFNAGLINEDTYQQERDFLDFLTIFANLKKTLEMYNLNFKTGNSDAISTSIFKVVQYYRQLLKTFQQYQFKYRRNSTFHNVFEPEYKSILGYAEIYLEKDHYLNNCRELAEATIQLDTLEENNLDSARIESLLYDLHFADIFNQQRLKESPEGETILQQINTLEEIQLKKEFEERINQLNQMSGEEKNAILAEELKKSAKSTHCLNCKEQGLQAVAAYRDKQRELHKKRLLEKADSLKKEAEKQLFKYISRVDQMQSNIRHYYAEEHASTESEMIQSKIEQAKKDVNRLKELIALPRATLIEGSIGEIQDFMESLTRYVRSVGEKLRFICDYKEMLCQDKEVLIKMIEQRHSEEPEDEQRKKDIRDQIQRFDRMIDSARAIVNGASSSSNAEVLRKKLDQMKEKSQEVKHQLNQFSQGNRGEGKMTFRQIDQNYRELKTYLASLCRQFPEFCVFTEPFTSLPGQ